MLEDATLPRSRNERRVLSDAQAGALLTVIGSDCPVLCGDYPKQTKRDQSESLHDCRCFLRAEKEINDEYETAFSIWAPPGVYIYTEPGTPMFLTRSGEWASMVSSIS